MNSGGESKVNLLLFKDQSFNSQKSKEQNVMHTGKGPES